MERDCDQEIDQLIDQLTQEAPYSAPTVAQQIVEKLQTHDPELLQQWLHRRATDTVRQHINRRDASTRARARLFSGRDAFAAAVAAHNRGEVDALPGWLDSVWVANNRHVRKHLRDMTGKEVQFAADRYTATAAQLAMTSAFLRAIAARVGDQTVSEVYSDEQLAQMWQSLGQ